MDEKSHRFGWEPALLPLAQGAKGWVAGIERQAQAALHRGALVRGSLLQRSAIDPHVAIVAP